MYYNENQQRKSGRSNKKLDEGMNYGYIVQDALYSESKPDSDDPIDHYEYDENCLISERYSYFKDMPSILIELDCIIEGDRIRTGKNYTYLLFDLTDFSVYKDSLYISYTIADTYTLEQEYYTLTIKKLNERGCKALKPLKFKWENISYYEDIESLL